LDTVADAGAESAPTDAQIAMVDGAQPTWTVPSGRVEAQPLDRPTDAEPVAATRGKGPNLAILGAGSAVLIGVALWFRRRA
jgi:hypothetical protein